MPLTDAEVDAMLSPCPICGQDCRVAMTEGMFENYFSCWVCGISFGDVVGAARI